MNQSLFLAVNAGWARPWLDPVMRAATLWGNPAVLFVTVSALLLALDRPRFKRNAMLLAAAIVLAILVSEPLKFVFNTPRPLLALGADKVRVLGKPELARGFPSGHTARAFAASTAVFVRYRAPGALLLAAAALTGLSRMYVGAHFPADVAGGLVIGLACGAAAARFWR